MKKLFVLTAVLAFSIAAVGCGGSSASSGAKPTMGGGGSGGTPSSAR